MGWYGKQHALVDVRMVARPALVDVHTVGQPALVDVHKVGRPRRDRLKRSPRDRASCFSAWTRYLRAARSLPAAWSSSGPAPPEPWLPILFARPRRAAAGPLPEEYWDWPSGKSA